MPLKLNLGLSRKMGEPNYGSRGASINLEVEIDTSLVAEPARFQERVRQLYALVRTSLAEELNGNGNGHAAHSSTGAAYANDHGAGNGNGHSATNGDKPRPATSAQLKAITAIAHRQKINLVPFLQHRIGVGRVADLTIKQASQVIDELKADVPAGG
jgi:hypothetical protein